MRGSSASTSPGRRNINRVRVERTYVPTTANVGLHIDYWDDTGFTADGTFVSENEFHHAGMIFRRER
jgi:hypothetical protein